MPHKHFVAADWAVGIDTAADIAAVDRAVGIGTAADWGADKYTAAADRAAADKYTVAVAQAARRFLRVKLFRSFRRKLHLLQRVSRIWDNTSYYHYPFLISLLNQA